MITEAIITFAMSVLNNILSSLPAPNISIPANVFTGAAQFLNVANYVLPFSTVSAIIVCLLGLQAFRIAVSLIKTFWDLLPFA